MSRVREQQKQERREAMLAAASRLFDRQGYARTTFEQIAEASGVGVATVYNYFGSKEGVVQALLLPDFERILQRGDRVIAKPPADPARAVMQLLREYGELGGHHWARRDLLRMAILPGVGNEGMLGASVREADQRTKVQILDLLKALRRRRQLAPRLDLSGATDVIFAVFNQHFAAYLTADAPDFSAMFSRMTRHIRLLFLPWRPSTNPTKKR